MININTNNLNELETKIHNLLTDAINSNKHLKIKISDAALICDCSTSKISKYVKKLGFENFKQYIQYMNGDIDFKKSKNSGELERLIESIENLDTNLIEDFASKFADYDKIFLFGYGPSLYCAEYFEYKLSIHLNKTISTIKDILIAKNMVDDKSIVIAFTTTGKFASFSEIYELCCEKGSAFTLVCEEYNTSLLNDYENVLFLTNGIQSHDLMHFEKTRSMTFIFIEEVISSLIRLNKES